MYIYIYIYIKRERERDTRAAGHFKINPNMVDWICPKRCYPHD